MRGEPPRADPATECPFSEQDAFDQAAVASPPAPYILTVDLGDNGEGRGRDDDEDDLLARLVGP
jgi:hypothetical protein